MLYHLGASVALGSGFLRMATVGYVVPYTLVRIRAEDRVLDEGFGPAFEEYRRRVATLVPGVLTP